MKRFGPREVREAMEFAEAGGQALHVWEPGAMFGDKAPRVFKRYKVWAHLIDHDAERLTKTARALGVRVIVIGRPGRRGQHIDLCGQPLERALAQAEP